MEKQKRTISKWIFTSSLSQLSTHYYKSILPRLPLNLGPTSHYVQELVYILSCHLVPEYKPQTKQHNSEALLKSTLKTDHMDVQSNVIL